MSDSLSAIAHFFSNHAEETAICVGDPDALERFYAELKKDFNLDELNSAADAVAASSLSTAWLDWEPRISRTPYVLVKA